MTSKSKLDKNTTSELKNKSNQKVIIGIILIILFWWLYLHPKQIRSRCNKIAQNRAINLMKSRGEVIESYSAELKKAAEKGFFLQKDYENYYEMCLREHGLKR